MAAYTAPARLVVFVGSYTKPMGHCPSACGVGVTAYSCDEATGALAPLGPPAALENPSFLCLGPPRPGSSERVLYAACEYAEGDGRIAALRVSPDGRFAATVPLSDVCAGGGAPCNLALGGEVLLCANYCGGTIGAWAVGADGSIGERIAWRDHNDQAARPADALGPRGARQEAAHPHCVCPAGAGHVLVADLGYDAVVALGSGFNGASAPLCARDARPLALPPGAGPRHVALHPSGARAFVIHELGCAISAHDFDPLSAELSPSRCTVATLPRGVDADACANTCAEVRCSRDGRFVYGSNRGHDSIATFAFDEPTAALQPLAHTSSGGRTPRAFALSPSERLMLVANQDSSSVVAFSRDAASGVLTPTGVVNQIGSPVFLLFAEL